MKGQKPKRPHRPASEAQLDFIVSLLEARQLSPEVERQMAHFGVGEIANLTVLTTVQASALITLLKECPRK